MTYTYRNETYGKFENPSTERIYKVFPGRHFEFDNVIGLWTDGCDGFFSEEYLQELIDLELFGHEAWGKYYKDLDMYSENKKLS